MASHIPAALRLPRPLLRRPLRWSAILSLSVLALVGPGCGPASGPASGPANGSAHGSAHGPAQGLVAGRSLAASTGAAVPGGSTPASVGAAGAHARDDSSSPASATTSGAAAASPTESAARFGVTDGLYPGPALPPARIEAVNRELARLGRVWLRSAGAGSAWLDVQPSRDTWDFSKLDAIYPDATQPWLFVVYGRTTYPFADGFSREQLASRRGRDVMTYLKQYELDVREPDQRDDAERYVREVARRYGDSIRYWEVGKEGLVRPGQVELQCETHRWLHDADADAQVLLTAVVGNSDADYAKQLDVLDRVLADGAADCFDVGNVHYYGHGGAGLERRLQQRMEEYRAVLARHGRGDAPIWVTETSTSSASDSPLSGDSDEAAQARDVVRRFVVLAAAGADVVMWHNYRIARPDDLFRDCTLVNRDGTPKPALATLKALVAGIGDATAIRGVLEGETTWVYRAERPGRSPAWVGWADAPTTVDLSRHLGEGRLEVTPLAGEGGAGGRQDAVGVSGQAMSTAAVALSPAPVMWTLVTSSE